MGKRADLDQVFEALADGTRRSILDRLRRGPATVGTIAEPYRMSLNAVSKHLMKLERAGLIEREVRGRERHCRLRAAAMTEAVAWMNEYRAFWMARLDGLERHLGAKRDRGDNP